jgi:hypothetical protein
MGVLAKAKEHGDLSSDLAPDGMANSFLRAPSPESGWRRKWARVVVRCGRSLFLREDPI